MPLDGSKDAATPRPTPISPSAPSRSSPEVVSGEVKKVPLPIARLPRAVRSTVVQDPRRPDDCLGQLRRIVDVRAPPRIALVLCKAPSVEAYPRQFARDARSQGSTPPRRAAAHPQKP